MNGKDISTPITGASVKVMRSYDYCHFEITLSSNDHDDMGLSEIDELRKEASRLADKAVEQYKIAKRVAEDQLTASRHAHYARDQARAVEAKPESERTSADKAILKAYEDYLYQANRHYDYEDDWEDAPDDDYDL